MRLLIVIMLPVLINSTLLYAQVYKAEVTGVIDPVVAEYVHRVIKEAEENRADAVLLVMDTPGGLDRSMRSIIKDILNSEVPVIGYVYPKGSRAASAGSFILMACHIAAMSPGTSIGAAHPVGITLTGEAKAVEEKITQDAASYMRSLADLRGRNTTMAESFVVNSISLTETEALKNGVIDVIADDEGDLLKKVDGRKVEVGNTTVTLETSGKEVVFIPMSNRDKFLHTISNPNLAYLLFMAGIYGIIFELSNPGAILPGIIGVVCILLALWSFQAISVSSAGLALILFGILLFIAEIKVASHGLLTAGGIGAIVLGSLLLINPAQEPFIRISYVSIASVVGITLLFFSIAIAKVVQAQRRRPSTGIEGMIGEIGEAKTDISPEGYVFVHGELWRARAEKPIKKGRKVKIVGAENLTLIVEEVK